MDPTISALIGAAIGAIAGVAGTIITMQPLDGFIVHASKLLAICAEKNLTPERAESLMREVYAVGSSAQTVIDEHNQKQETQQAASSNPLERRS